MSRWEPGADGRIVEAAMALFAERGFENTTVAEISERAGVTRRTFFRHFADKRDVVFGGHAHLADTVAAVVAAVPLGNPAMDVLRDGLRILAEDVFDGQQLRMRAIRSVIRSDDSLRERDEHKYAIIAAAGEQAFRDRGVGEIEARLIAGMAALALSVAIDRWIDAPDGTDLAVIAIEVVESMRGLALNAAVSTE